MILKSFVCISTPNFGNDSMQKDLAFRFLGFDTGMTIGLKILYFKKQSNIKPLTQLCHQ